MKTRITLYSLMFLVSFSFVQAQTTVVIRLSPSTGQDAYVSDYYPNINFRTYPDLIGWAWTRTGTPLIGRSFFRFNLAFIPSNATISEARLSLYGNPSPASGPGHSTLSGSNACWLRRVISPWNDTFVTWSSQPSITTANQVTLPASTSSMQDYPNIDVTNMVREMVANPSANYGMVIMLQTEVHYRSMNFASSDCSDSTKWPKLLITYTPVGITPISSELPDDFRLYQNYPNPFNPSTKIRFDIPSKQNGVSSILKVFDILGNEIATLIDEPMQQGTYEVQWNASNYSSGIYYYRLVTGKYADTKRMTVVK